MREPTPIYRLIHIGNLKSLLERQFLHAPNFTPADGMHYITIHNSGIQASRSIRPVSCGPRGVLHDYIPFYFGPRSPMLYQLHTGQVAGYTEGQSPLIYLVSDVQNVVDGALPFVFSDGQGIAAYTRWFDQLEALSLLDWKVIQARSWKRTADDPDRQRRKQAEFLVFQSMPWNMIKGIAVWNQNSYEEVAQILGAYPSLQQVVLKIRPEWYY